VKAFFEGLNRLSKPGRPDLTEKDFRLHLMLDAMSKDEFLRENLLFKGGTCLLKAYLGYYRFSEDLDFTWRDPLVRKIRSKSAAARQCSRLIDDIIDRLARLSANSELEFSGDKRNPKEVRIGSGGRMATFFLRYPSEMLGSVSVLKVEVNFIEDVLFGPSMRRLGSFIDGLEAKELRFLYRDWWDRYSGAVTFPCYDLKEIIAEKARAAITRKGFNARDLIDLYYIESRTGLTVDSMKAEIIQKTRFVLGLYKKYRENIELERAPPVSEYPGAAGRLLLGPIPEDLPKRMTAIQERLNRIRNEILPGG